MSQFSCSRCGTRMEAPAPGATAACPGCGQLFETPATSAAPPPRSSRDDPYGDERGDARYPDVGRRTHSGVGIASFLIGLIVIVIDLLLVLLLVVLATGGAGYREGRTVGTLAGVFNCIGVLACLAGLGLGVAGLFQEDRNRTFAVLGVILNGLVILIVAGLFIVGMAMGGMFG